MVSRESLVCEDFGTACQGTVWGLLNSSRGGDEVSTSLVERRGPGTLSSAGLLTAPLLGAVAQTV